MFRLFEFISFCFLGVDVVARGFDVWFQVCVFLVFLRYGQFFMRVNFGIIVCFLEFLVYAFFYRYFSFMCLEYSSGRVGRFFRSLSGRGSIFRVYRGQLYVFQGVDLVEGVYLFCFFSWILLLGIVGVSFIWVLQLGQ